MTATGVYGVRLGDEFKDPEGNHFRVEEFITPTGPAQEWTARLHLVDDESIGVQATVKDIKEWEKVNT